MAIGLVGRKCGMTRVFTDAGESLPVTVIEALPNRVTRVKSVETDGYRALQVTSGQVKASRSPRSPGPIAMEEGLRFAIREGGRTVGAGVVAKIIE